jgi:hypothetical protein
MEQIQRIDPYVIAMHYSVFKIDLEKELTAPFLRNRAKPRIIYSAGA